MVNRPQKVVVRQSKFITKRVRRVIRLACSVLRAKGNADDWTDRLAQGMDVLLEHSINGFNAMPPRGGCMNCTDEEIEAAIEYMIEGL